MKYLYSIWATDARVLKNGEDSLEQWMFSIRAGGQEKNAEMPSYGYVWISDHEVEVTLPKLEDRIEGIQKGFSEKIQKVRTEAEREVMELSRMLGEILALTYESEVPGAQDVLDA